MSPTPRTDVVRFPRPRVAGVVLLVVVLVTALLSATLTGSARPQDTVVAAETTGIPGLPGITGIPGVTPTSTTESAVLARPAMQQTPTRTGPVVRSVVSAGPGGGQLGLVQAQLREQRASQLQTMVQTLLQTQPAASVTDEVDPRLDASSCALLGRTWTSAGCSRQSCVVGHEYAKTGANAETCRIGGRRGASYGVEVDFRRCSALHRVWIGLLNYCASDPHRDQVVVPHAPQCVAPYTTYVVMSERQGAYDECLRPRRVAQLDQESRATGATLAAVAADHSATQCSWQAQHVFTDGLCVPGRVTPRLRDNVFVVGDSITWRGTNELATLQPDWIIDGSSGRQVDALADQLNTYREAYGEPGGVIFALGTNGRSGWTEEQFRDSVAALPAGTPVLFVTPFREPGGSGRPELSDAYAEWMQTLAAQRPRTCLADWRSAVGTDNALLVDGVHPTTLGEVFWAELVDSSWDDCTRRFGLTSS